MSNKIIDFRNLLHKRKDGGNMCDILRKLEGKTAEELLAMQGIDITKPPVDIELLVKNLNISVKKKDFSEIEKETNSPSGSILGAAISHGKTLTVFYSSRATYNRMRFTVAHELAHCCLHSRNLEINHVELRMNLGDEQNAHERDANIFAGELLIPEKLLDQECKKFIVPSLKALAEMFEVSVNVMAARLDMLNYQYLKDAPFEQEGI